MKASIPGACARCLRIGVGCGGKCERWLIGFAVGCSLFAYGQTGSGKSYSMVGYGTNKGIVPITCDEIFKKIELNDQPDKFQFQVRAPRPSSLRARNRNFQLL